MHSRPRCAVFIDGGYFKEILRQYNNPRIDYNRVSEALASYYERLRTYYYDCPPYLDSRSPDERSIERKERFDRFRQQIERLPRFQTRLGRLLRIEVPTPEKYKHIQKKVDVLLAVDLLWLSMGKHIDRAVLVTGDTDFVPAIEMVRSLGVIVVLHYSRQLPHPDELLEACDETFEIDGDFIRKIKAS